MTDNIVSLADRRRKPYVPPTETDMRPRFTRINGVYIGPQAEYLSTVDFFAREPEPKSYA